MRIGDFLRRLKPTRNTPSLVGYLILAVEVFGRLMDAVDLFAVTKTVWGYLPGIWQFLTSDLGTIIGILIGLILIGYGSTQYERAKTSRQLGKSRDIEAERFGNILRTMMNADNGRPDRCVLVRPIRFDLSHIKDIGGPYLVFVFSIYNSSIYSIKFDKQPTGHLIYEQQELKDSLEFLPGGLKPTIHRTGEESIELRQFLLPEVASKIMDMSNMKTKIVSFSFDTVYFPIETIKPNGDIGDTWKCPLPKEVSFDLPVDSLVAFPH